MEQSDWNRFWSRSSGGRFTRESWSKKRIMTRLDRYLQPGARVLDAGCGCGHFTMRFVEKGCRVTALDRSEEALRIARELTANGAEKYISDDLMDEGFRGRHGGSYDLVFTDGLFEHFEPDGQERIMRNLVGSLDRGGIVATFVPNALSPWRFVRPFLMPGIHEKPFRPARLRELHRGLEIVDEGGLNVFPFRVSPEGLGPRFGMLLYVIGRGRDDRP